MSTLFEKMKNAIKYLNESKEDSTTLCINEFMYNTNLDIDISKALDLIEKEYNNKYAIRYLEKYSDTPFIIKTKNQYKNVNELFLIEIISKKINSKRKNRYCNNIDFEVSYIEGTKILKKSPSFWAYNEDNSDEVINYMLEYYDYKSLLDKYKKFGKSYTIEIYDLNEELEKFLEQSEIYEWLSFHDDPDEFYRYMANIFTGMYKAYPGLKLEIDNIEGTITFNF